MRALDAIPDNFCFSSFQLLKDATIEEHIDKNQGLSLLVALGDFSGGRLVIDGEEFIDVCKQPYIFDGQRPHFIEKHEGTRWSIALYQHPRANELSSLDISFLLGVGFSWTDAGDFGFEPPPPRDTSETMDKSVAPEMETCLVLLELDMALSSAAEVLGQRCEALLHVVFERQPDALRCAQKRWMDAYCSNNLDEVWEAFGRMLQAGTEAHQDRVSVVILCNFYILRII